MPGTKVARNTCCMNRWNISNVKLPPRRFLVLRNFVCADLRVSFRCAVHPIWKVNPIWMHVHCQPQPNKTWNILLSWDGAYQCISATLDLVSCWIWPADINEIPNRCPCRTSVYCCAGAIPSVFGRLRELHSLELGNNQLTGTDQVATLISFEVPSMHGPSCHQHYCAINTIVVEQL